MIKGLFITGTDTDCGKTYFTSQLLQASRLLQLRTIALKPVASGCDKTSLGLRNADALTLQHAASVHVPYEWVNPMALEPAIAPSIAAEKIGLPLTVEAILLACQPALQMEADYHLLEGCGGWLCPLQGSETMADLAQALNWPLILVVGLRLGCLNHALLTWRQLQQCALPVLGWVANHAVADMLMVNENIQTLTRFMGAPPLAILQHQQALLPAAAATLFAAANLMNEENRFA